MNYETYNVVLFDDGHMIHADSALVIEQSQVRAMIAREA